MAIQDGNGRLRFNGTINAGHVLTTLAMIVAGFSAWYRLESRIGQAEVRMDAMSQTATIVTQYTEQRLNRQDEAHRQALTEIKRQLERIEDKIDRKVDRP